MTKNLKYYIGIILFIGLILLIKSRIVPHDHFEVMVLNDYNEIHKACIIRAEAKINKSDFSPPENVKFYFTKYGDTLCEDKSNLRNKIEETLKESFHSQWLFVF